MGCFSENEGKNMLIEQHARWCGHCKNLVPKLDKVAAALMDTETVLIAMMDLTENDPPKAYKAKGYPTLHSFPAGGKEAIDIDGDRDSR